MEYIFDYPDEVMALYACGHSFRQAVRIADCMDDECCERIRLCITMVFGAFKNGYITLVPNYHDEVLTEAEVRDDLVNTIRKSMSGQYEERSLSQDGGRDWKNGSNIEQVSAAEWMMAMFACGFTVNQIIDAAGKIGDEETLKQICLCVDVFWGPFEDTAFVILPVNQEEPIQESDIRDALVRLFRNSKRKRIVRSVSAADNGNTPKREWLAIRQEDEEVVEEAAIDPACREIEDYAYAFCTKITSVEIPVSVNRIGDSAFKGCTGLTSIVIPDSVTEIGSFAFRGCTGLTGITIPNSVTFIGYNAFEGCTGLTGIVIPDSVTEILTNTFGGCSSLTSIIIPDSVRIIDFFAFSGCTGLTSITIPDSVTEIGSYAFSGCTGLTSIVIPDSVTEIGKDAFAGCSGLARVVVPDSVKIGDNAFIHCPGLLGSGLPGTEIEEERRAPGDLMATDDDDELPF